MLPVANFSVTPTLLSVKFMDISTGTPTSWSWDFGDSGAASTQNPTHTYSISGKYIVKLTATNSSGTSILQREIMVSTVPILPVTIKTFVNLKLPSGNTISEEKKDAYIAEAQLHIQPLVDPEVVYANVFDETKYPPLANALVAFLAAYNILLDLASTGVAANAGNLAGGAIKKIVTGPSEVEYQDASALAKTLMGDSGLLSSVQKEACSLARRLNIFLPFCPALPKPHFVDLKAGRAPTPITWLQYPYTIPLTL